MGRGSYPAVEDSCSTSKLSVEVIKSKDDIFLSFLVCMCYNEALNVLLNLMTILLQVEELRLIMTSMGERLSRVEVEDMVREMLLLNLILLFRCARLICRVQGRLIIKHLPGLSLVIRNNKYNWNILG